MSNVARKLIPGLLVGSLAWLSACAGTNDSPAADGTKPKSISYWSFWQDGEPQQKVIAEAIAAWEKKTGIKVDAQWQGRSVTQKLTPALNTKQVPDLVDASFSKLALALMETKQYAPLDAAYAKKLDGDKTLKDLLPSKYTKNSGLVVEGSPWMVPYTITAEGIWFNAAKNPELKTAPPKTWQDFSATLTKLKSNGMTPLAQDGDLSGYNAMWFVSGLVREQGPGSFRKLVEDKSGEAWKAPEVRAIAQRIEKLVSDGMFITGYNASKFPAQQQAWAANKAVLLLNGSWIPTETSTYAASGFEYASFPMPTEQQGKKYTRADFIGFAVPKKSQSQKWAADLAAFTMRKEWQQKFASKAKVLPVREDVNVPQELSSVKDEITKSDSIYQQNDGVTTPGYIEKVFWPVVSDLVLGNIKTDEFVNRMAKEQAQYWKDQG